MLSKNRWPYRTHFATLLNNFPSLCVYGPLPSEHLCVFTNCRWCPLTMMASQTRNGLPSHSQEQGLAGGNRACRVSPPPRQSLIRAPRSAWNSGEKPLPNRAGPQEPAARVSWLTWQTLVVVIIAPRRCPDQTQCQWFCRGSHIDNDPRFIMCLCMPKWLCITKTMYTEHSYKFFILTRLLLVL